MADGQDAIELKRRARRRLVGAIALVVFVVIALPIVLDREPKPVSQDLTIQIPSQEAGKFSSRILPPQGEASKADSAPVAQARPEAAPKNEAAKELKPELKSEAKPATRPEAKAEAKASPAPIPLSAKAAPAETSKPEAAPAKPAAKPVTAAAGGFVVPLGMFSRADNIKQVRGKAEAAGIKTYTETMAKGNVRVRAGPFDNRDTAEKARDKLKGAGLDVGAVVSR